MTLGFEDQTVATEIKLLNQALLLQYGHDFRNYDQAAFTRRILRALGRFGLSSIRELVVHALRDKTFFMSLLNDLMVTVTEMFRDPEVYRILATEVLPVLATYPSIRIWHAGCSTGEEVYSMAILLKEGGLLSRSTLYATDINPFAVSTARAGVFPLSEIKKARKNYQNSGCQGSFSDYYREGNDSFIIDQSLKDNIVFAEHNLVTDGVFSEVHLVLCRNVLIYFNRTMQSVVLKKFKDSLIFKGFLCLGTNESLQFNDYKNDFAALEGAACVFQKLH